MALIGVALWISHFNFVFLLNDEVARGLVGFFWGTILYRIIFKEHYHLTMLVAPAVSLLIVLLAMRAGGVQRLDAPVVWVLSAIGLTVIARWPLLQSVLALRPLAFLGDISLAVYLVHVPVQVVILLIFAVLHRSIPYSYFAFWAAYMIAVMMIASLVHIFYERPALVYLRRSLIAKRETSINAP
jgi:peptidoglycan/LPS O-acetylase OafA/YrhL